MIRGRKSKGNIAMFFPKRKRICTKACGYPLFTPHSVRSKVINGKKISYSKIHRKILKHFAETSHRKHELTSKVEKFPNQKSV